MTLTNFSTDNTAASSAPTAQFGELESARSSEAAPKSGFVDRRAPRRYSGGKASESSERRQFGSSHAELSEAGRELAAAIDRYKLQHHRRYITCDEMLSVLHQLGYERVADLK